MRRMKAAKRPVPIKRRRGVKTRIMAARNGKMMMRKTIAGVANLGGFDGPMKFAKRCSHVCLPLTLPAPMKSGFLALAGNGTSK